MNSPKNKVPDTDPGNFLSLELPPAILLSLTTAPVLLGIITLQNLTRSLTDLGKMSEEIFRGNRLPVFHFSNSQEEP